MVCKRDFWIMEPWNQIFCLVNVIPSFSPPSPAKYIKTFNPFNQSKIAVLKVTKSQNHFSWNSIAQKTNVSLDKILP